MDSTIKRDWQIFRMVQNVHLRMVIYCALEDQEKQQSVAE